MKKEYKKNGLKFITACLLCIGLNKHSVADCIASAKDVYINFPSSVVLQADMPIGTVIATGTSNYTIRCIRESGMTASEYSWQIYYSPNNISLGPAIGTNADMAPTGISGIGLHWINNTSNVGDSLMTDSQLNNPNKGRGIPSADGSYVTTTFIDRFKLIKTGEIDIGSQSISLNPIAMRRKSAFGSVSPAGDLYTIRFTPFALVNAACSLSDSTINVDMGIVAGTKFTGVGSTSESKSFTIGLDCVVGTKVNITLDSPTPEAGFVGTTALSAGSTASGLGIQITDTGDAPIQFQQSKYVGEATSSFMTIPYKARYIQTDSTITPGTANGLMTLNIDYL